MKKLKKFGSALNWLIFCGSLLLGTLDYRLAKAQTETPLPEGFAYLRDIDPTIIQEMRYFSHHNFVGRPIPGYFASQCILTTEAAKGLALVQADLKEYSMSLKVYDCYRPQKAVDSFVLWAKDISDNKMKKEFYPKVDKSTLFKDGYIAEKSGHSRGSTIDLTVVPLPVPKQAEYRDGEKLKTCYASASQRFKDNSLDFGTGFDCFDPLAHTANPQIDGIQKQRRLMLKSIMEKHGFKNYSEEWWHFTLSKETFPDRYFNFDVR